MKWRGYTSIAHFMCMVLKITINLWRESNRLYINLWITYLKRVLCATNLKMKVGARGIAGGAHIADDFAAHHALADVCEHL